MYEWEPDQKKPKTQRVLIMEELNKYARRAAENRKEVHEKLRGIWNYLTGQANLIESMYSSAIEEFSTQENNHLQTALKALKECVAKGESGETLQNAIQTAQTELDTKQTYGAASQKAKMEFLVDPNDFRRKGNALDNMSSDPETLMEMLSERIDVSYKKRSAAAGRLQEICEELKKQVNEFFEETKRKIEDAFSREDSRLRGALDGLKMFSESSHGEEEMDSSKRGGGGGGGEEGKYGDNEEDIEKKELKITNSKSAIQKAYAELIIKYTFDIKKCNTSSSKYGRMTLFNDFPLFPLFSLLASKQRYKKQNNDAVNSVIENNTIKISDIYKLEETSEFVGEFIRLDELPTLKLKRIKGGRIFVNIFRNPYEERSLRLSGFRDAVSYKVRFSKDGEDAEEYPLTKEWKEGKLQSLLSFLPKSLEAFERHTIELKTILKDRESRWFYGTKFRPTDFQECCLWKVCLGNGRDKLRYSLDPEDPRIVTKNDESTCAIIGNIPIPFNKTVSWNITILESKEGDCNGLFVGIAPSNVNSNISFDPEKYGWHLNCFNSTLCSGPPHMYKNRLYGPRIEDGGYFQEEDTIGVVLNTTNGDLSFVVNKVDYGIAFREIPLDRPLSPCVLLGYKGDSVQLDSTKVKEVVKPSTPVPPNVVTKSDRWDTITVTWDSARGALFYQVEVDGSNFYGLSTTDMFSMRGFLPETMHTFRVRTVKSNSVSEWSKVVIGKTGKKSFETSWWKESPYNADGKRRYITDTNNPRIATNTGYEKFCTIIWDAPLPANRVVSWSVKILKSKDGWGSHINIGIAPQNINLNDDFNFMKNGWYFYCFDSTLWSGPPHFYKDKPYGPRKGHGRYIREKERLGVIVDTLNGELSFVLNNSFIGIAYERIPLNKPLFPCVILENKQDSIELCYPSINQ